MTIDTALRKPPLNPLGQLIKEKAVAQGLSMRAVASKAHITYAGLHKLMKAPNHKPNLSTLMALETAIGVPLESLIAAAQPAEPEPIKEAA